MPVRHPQFANVKLFDHPLIRHKLTLIRDRRTGHAEFRRLLNEIAGLMTYEVCRDIETEEIPVETPVARTTGHRLKEKVTLVPVLRAGLGMCDGILALFPEARVGHIGIYRDEHTATPVEYYRKLPRDVAAGPVFLVDPMLATGGSAAKAVADLRSIGCKRLQMICLVAAPEGIRRMQDADPDVIVNAAAIDERLNERFFIVPGLGDAGDRIFGTA
ncbi:MAG: uracil phosphoribosyltransferase [Phycisphaerae bacterium]|nr:uracil phosphoribosyltransferase [Phycisphaerae bacterium]